MKLNLLIPIPLTLILLGSSFAKADDYDRKAAAAAQAEEQVAAVKATTWFSDSWRLQNIEWNGVPVKTRSDGIYADPAYAFEITPHGGIPCGRDRRQK